MIYWIAYFFFKTLSLLFFPLRVFGRDFLPSDGGFIIASNHVSYMDPFILGLASKRRLSYVARESLFQNRILRFLLYRVDAFPIKRNTTDFRAVREALRRLKRGAAVVLFPEGTSKGKSGQKKVQPGIGFIATKAGRPVIPAYIYGSDKVLPPGQKMLRRHRVTVIFGEPIYLAFDAFYPGIASHIMEKIFSLAPSK